MNPPENHPWQNLVALSAPAYAAADATPPYGLATRVLAGLRAEEHERELVERIGLRAILASFLVLALTAAFAVGWSNADRGDLEPGLRGLLQAANVPLS